MGLKETLADAAVTIVNAFDNLPDEIEYHSIVVGGYNVENDAPIIVDTVLNFKGLLVKTKEADQDYKKTTLYSTKVIVAGLSFGNVVPKESDYMIIDGIRYEIMVITPAPGKAVYVFQVRVP